MIPGRNAGNKLPEMQAEEWYGGNLSSGVPKSLTRWKHHEQL